MRPDWALERLRIEHQHKRFTDSRITQRPVMVYQFSIIYALPDAAVVVVVHKLSPLFSHSAGDAGEGFASRFCSSWVIPRDNLAIFIPRIVRACAYAEPPPHNFTGVYDIRRYQLRQALQPQTG